MSNIYTYVKYILLGNKQIQKMDIYVCVQVYSLSWIKTHFDFSVSVGYKCHFLF